MRTILTVLVTSLFWTIGIIIYCSITEPQESDVKEEVVVSEQLQSKPAPKIKKPKAEPAPKVEKPKAPAKNYAELICGYWLPVEGTTSKLDISKYGTVTRYYRLLNIDHWYDDRYEYSISGNKLVVNDYYKCTVNVFEENGTTYLEIYGHEYYAGKYRKRK